MSEQSLLCPSSCPASGLLFSINNIGQQCKTCDTSPEGRCQMTLETLIVTLNALNLPLTPALPNLTIIHPSWSNLACNPVIALIQANFNPADSLRVIGMRAIVLKSVREPQHSARSPPLAYCGLRVLPGVMQCPWSCWRCHK